MLHAVSTARLDSQGQSRKPVGDEIHPQNLHGEQGKGIPRRGPSIITQISPVLQLVR